jgi:aspartate ammonia-lyase
MAEQVRIEKDSLGTKEIPAGAYYGIQTQRAVINFPITGIQIGTFPHVVRALALVKKAAAHANVELGILPREIGLAISKACDELLEGKHHDQFVVDVIQGGAGTSTNMNANEVIANLALEHLGKKKGEYAFCHPNDHVNLSQSTNDAYPTAVRIALYFELDEVTTAMAELRTAFEQKTVEFADVIKMGRTQLQDAVPMTLGQEFSTYATMVGEDIQRVHEAAHLLREMNMGATAIGTGINAPEGYADAVRRYLNEFGRLSFVTAGNLVEATQDAGVFVQLSGVLKRFAVKLSKICNDLRLLSMGPRAGLNEINLPPQQPGSSIMPGKVNPVIPEVVNQICFQVIGNDVTISMAAEGGQMQLNAFEPVILFNLYRNIDMLARGCRTLTRRCVSGITANRDVCRMYVERSIGIVTALNPMIGYEKSAEVAKEALRSGKNVGEVAIAKGYVTQADLDELLRPERMLSPSFGAPKKK